MCEGVWSEGGGVRGNRNGKRSPEQYKGALASRQQPPATTWHRDLILFFSRRCQQLPGWGCLWGPLRVRLPACSRQRLQRPLQREPGGEHRNVCALRTELWQRPPGAVCIGPPALYVHGSRS